MPDRSTDHRADRGVRRAAGGRGVRAELDDVRPAVVAGEDERGREIRTGLLSPPGDSTSKLRRRLLTCVVGALVLTAPASAAAAERTGRLLVTLEPHASVQAASALTLAGARRDGAQVPQLGLVSVRPTAGQALSALA